MSFSIRLKSISRTRWLLLALALAGITAVAVVNSRSSLSVKLLPTIRCVYGVLSSNPAIQSVNVYAIDDFRIGFEYAFKDESGQPAVSYEELVAPNLDAGLAFLGDKIPREVTEHAMMEGGKITDYGRSISQTCYLDPMFDNLFPQPPARSTWRRLDISKDLH